MADICYLMNCNSTEWTESVFPKRVMHSLHCSMLVSQAIYELKIFNSGLDCCSMHFLQYISTMFRKYYLIRNHIYWYMFAQRAHCGYVNYLKNLS